MTNSDRWTGVPVENEKDRRMNQILTPASVVFTAAQVRGRSSKGGCSMSSVSWVRTVAVGAVFVAWGCGSTDDAEDMMSGTGDTGSDVEMEAVDETPECALIVGGHCIKHEVTDECGLDTGYDGDIMCLKPPSEDEGFQMHIGPDAYTAEAMEPFVLPPGEEGTRCVWLETPNDSVQTYYDRTVHMRPVSHHMISSIMGDSMPEGYEGGWGPCGSTRNRFGSLGGSEIVQMQYPANGIYPPEFAGVGRALAPHAVVRLEMHYINTTDQDLLREMWMNVYYKPAESVTEWVADLNVIGGTRVETPPGTHRVTYNTQPVAGVARVVSIFGHYHAHTTRFSVWKKSGDEHTLVYEDYDWFDPANFNYNSITDNPTPDRDLLLPGASSGILDLDESDEMYWECEVVNDSEVTLTFSDQALTGEMCNVFGEFIGDADLAVAGQDGDDMSIDEWRERGLDQL